MDTYRISASPPGIRRTLRRSPRIAVTVGMAIAATVVVVVGGAGKAMAQADPCQEYVTVVQTSANGRDVGVGSNTLAPGEFSINTVTDPAHRYIFLAGVTLPLKPATFRFLNDNGDKIRDDYTVLAGFNGVIPQEPHVIPFTFTQPGQRVRIFADFHTRCGGPDVVATNKFVGSIVTFPANPVAVNPKYLVLGVTYAPPGSASFIDYGSSTTLGSRLTFGASLQAGISQSTTLTINQTISVGSSSSFSQRAQDSSTTTVEKTTSSNIIIPGPRNSLDGIDHNEDIIFVWLNPKFNATSNSFTAILWSGFDVDPRDPVSPNMDVVQLSVGQLKDPSLISPGDASRLQRSWSPSGALNTADFNDILTRDPFANGSTAIDPARFDLVQGATFNYRPADPGGQPITQRFNVRFQEASTLSAAFTFTAGVKFDLSGTTDSVDRFRNALSTRNQTSQTLDISASVAIDQSTAANQSANLSLTGPTAGYQGPTSLQVYQDNLFGTLMFAFAPVPTFQISAPSPNQTVTQGNSAAFPVATRSDFGFTGNVNFDPNVMGLPAGAQASFSPASVGVGGGTTMSVTTAAQTPSGTYPLTITASSGLIVRHLTVNLMVNALPFMVTLTPSTRTVASGQNTTYTVNVNAVGGFTGPVVLSGPNGLPPGTTGTFNPVTINGSGSSTLTVTTSPGTPSGSSTLTVMATGGGITQQGTVGLVVDNTQDFGLTATPQAVGVAAGDIAVYTVTTTGINGFTGNVSLAISGLPSGATPTFGVNPIAGSGSSTLRIATTTGTTPGDYLVTITGTSGSIGHSQSVTMTVSPPPDFTLAVSPGTQSASAGTGVSYPVAIDADAGFSDNVSLTVAGLPADVSGTFNPTTAAAGSDTTLFVSVGATVATGTYPLTVTGTSGGRSHSQTVSLTVTAEPAADFTVTAEPNTASIPRTLSGVLWVSAARVSDTFNDNIELSIGDLPAGVTTAFDATEIYVDSGVNLYIFVAASTPPGIYTLTLTGTSGGSSHHEPITLTVT